MFNWLYLLDLNESAVDFKSPNSLSNFYRLKDFTTGPKNLGVELCKSLIYNFIFCTLSWIFTEILTFLINTKFLI